MITRTAVLLGALTLAGVGLYAAPVAYLDFLADLAREYAALLISICALFLTISQAMATHKHNRLTVRPHLATFTENKADPERKGIRIIKVQLSNSGLGPAIIKTFEPLLDGVPVKADDSDDLFPVVKQTIPASMIDDECCISVLRPEHVMAKDEVVTLARLAIVPTIHDDPEALKKALDRFQIRVSYESAYGESFVYDSRNHRQLV